MQITLPRTVTDLALLVARVVVGVVFLAHGLQKIDTGHAGVTAGFEQLGVPAPAASAFVATWVETIGGALLILGLALPVAALLLVADMVGALALVHAPNGVFVDQGGWELVAVLAAACLLLAATGAGRLSVDALVASRRAGAEREPAMSA